MESFLSMIFLCSLGGKVSRSPYKHLQEITESKLPLAPSLLLHAHIIHKIRFWRCVCPLNCLLINIVCAKRGFAPKLN